MLGAAAIGAYPDVHRACAGMCEVDMTGTQEPRTEMHALYTEMGRLHDTIYRSLNAAGVYEMAANLTAKMKGEYEV